MKLTALLLIVVCLHVSAHSYSQTVSFSGKNVPLQTVFSSFEKQTGLSFFFNYALIKDIKPVTLDVREMPLEDALNMILQGQGLGYYRNGKTIFIVKRDAEPAVAPTAQGTSDDRQVNVSGRVTNQQGEALPGASVVEKDGKKSTLTNEKGIFTLRGVPVGMKLVITYAGYQKQEVEVDGEQIATVVLAMSNNQLDKVQVIAYGTTTERLSTGNVTTVTSKEIEQQPVSNPLLALEGRVPGLVITQANGMPGSSITVRIQGQNSIQNGNDPFFVIDGVPYSSQVLQGISPAGGSPFDFINPSDIESISVLKDADATAIYGSRAANGAILITTKKGKAGDTKFEINFQNGYGGITRMLPVLNTQQYLEMRHEAINNDGLTIQPLDYDINGVWDTTRNINWQKQLLGNSTQFSNLYADISGGNVFTQYIIGGTYNRQTPSFPGNFVDQKASLHFNINTTSADKKFRINLNGNYLFENNQLPGTDLTQEAYRLAPDAPPLLNKDGSINWALDQNGNSTFIGSINPMTYTLRKYENKNNNLIGNAILSYQIAPGLEVKSNFGYTSQIVNEIGTSPLTVVPPSQQPYVNRSAEYTYNNLTSWIVEPQINYRKSFEKFKLEALIGSTFEQNNTNTLILEGIGYSSDLLLEDPRSANTISVYSTSGLVYKYNALFSRVNLSWDEKYMVNLSARRDGSSRFGPANEFHDFGAIGTGWIFSKEKTIENNFSFLSFGKLRASYGTTGSDQIGDYTYLNLYNSYGLLPYGGIVSLVPFGLTNPNLQWEETKKLEFGLDLGFLHDRILINGTYVRNRSSNQLLGYNLPIITGATSIARNFPATVQNAEGEFSITSVNFKGKNFSWSTRVNLTIPNNKLVAFPGLSTSSYSSFLQVGKPLTALSRVYHFLGVNDTSGLYQFASSKGGPTSNPQFGTDNNITVNITPKLYGGFENTFDYKGIELNIMFQFMKHAGYNYAFGDYPGNVYYGNQPTYVLNRWQKPGDHASIQRYNTNYKYYFQWQDAAYSSDAAFADASYVRLKNLAISYQLPKSFVNKIKLSVFKIYLHGQNLLTFTRYRGLDPESPGGSVPGFPPIRVLTGGIQIIF